MCNIPGTITWAPALPYWMSFDEQAGRGNWFDHHRFLNLSGRMGMLDWHQRGAQRGAWIQDPPRCLHSLLRHHLSSSRHYLSQLLFSLLLSLLSLLSLLFLDHLFPYRRQISLSPSQYSLPSSRSQVALPSAYGTLQNRLQSATYRVPDHSLSEWSDSRRWSHSAWSEWRGVDEQERYQPPWW